MKKKIYFVFLVAFTSCMTPRIEVYKDENPKLDLRTFFDGKLIAKGLVQNRSGKVVQRFVVDMNANWQKNTLHLDEKFVYADGSKSERLWKITEISNKRYSGKAHDVVEDAEGVVEGNAFYFDYVLQIPVDGTTYDITIDDWMYLIDEQTMIAKSEMSKFGFKVGEITLVMNKI